MRWSRALLGLCFIVVSPAVSDARPLSGADHLQPTSMVGTIVGRVIETGTGQPVSGAVMAVTGTQITALTNAQGRYVIRSVPAGQHTVTVRRLGFADASQTVTVTDNAQAMLDFTVTAVAVQLNEVVITATSEQRKREIGNTVASVPVAAVVAAAPITNVTDVLQGRVAGLMTFANSGITGSAP